MGKEKWSYPKKQLHGLIRSYLVKNNEFIELKDSIIKHGIIDGYLRERFDRYEIFYREYYWSQAYEDFINDYEKNGLGDRYDQKTNELITNLNVTVNHYSWEGSDYSKEVPISYLVPCKEIYEGAGLQYSQNEGEYTNTSGEIICFSDNTHKNFGQALLIKKVALTKYLDDNDLRIIWTVWGAKQVSGGHESSHLGYLNISGVYYLEQSELKGEINSEYEKP